MNNLEIEKIRRRFYHQAKEKAEEDKKKFPALNGLITNENIYDYFEFDEKSPKSLSTSIFSDKEIKLDSTNEEKKPNIDYDINSFFDNDQIPDLYTPLGKISGDNYQLRQYDSDMIENFINSDSDYKTISKKRLRYFDLDLDIPEIELIFYPKTKINKKSKSKKHLNYSPKTFYPKKLCYICLSSEHSDKYECPKYKKCFKCLKYGHWAKNCEEIINNKCDNCKISSHNKEDCLKFNEGIKYEDFLLLKKNNKGLKCAFCGNKNHLICPFSIREKYKLNYQSGENKKQNNGKIKDFSKTLFCPFCAGNHLKKNCPEINKNKNISKSNYSSLIENSFESFGSFDNNKIKNSRNDDWEINQTKEDNNLNNNKNINDQKVLDKTEIKKEISLYEEKDNIFKEKNYNYFNKRQYNKRKRIYNNKREKGNLYIHYKKCKERKEYYS